MKNVGYWLKRLALNVRGFLAASLAMFLPTAAPIFRKLIAGYLGKAAMVVNTTLGLTLEWDPVILVLTNVAIGFLEQAAIWRAPNALPTVEDKRNPIIGTAVEVPPR